MTARPIIPECRRKPVRVAVALCIVIVAVLLAVGSTGLSEPAITPIISGNESPTGNSSSGNGHDEIPAVPASDKELAEQALASAAVRIEETDRIIAWFMGNESTRNFPELSRIITKRELSLGYTSIANDEIARGNYAQAHTNGLYAYAKANESYHDALDLQHQIYGPPREKSVIPFDRIILISLMPALLIAGIRSLGVTCSPRLNGILLNCVGRISLPGVFLGAWMLNAGLLLTAVMVRIEMGSRVSSITSIIWVCLILAQWILAIVVVGTLTIQWIRSLFRPVSSVSGNNGERMTINREKIWRAVKIILVLILILLIPVVIVIGYHMTIPPLYF